MHAVKIDTGEVLWTYTALPDCNGDRATRVKSCGTNIGLSAAPAVIDGAVIEGSLDGFLRAFDAKTGEVLFQFDTARTFEAVNGVEAKGGSIDARVDHGSEWVSVRELRLRNVRASWRGMCCWRSR